jgi:hypothetical protein
MSETFTCPNCRGVETSDGDRTCPRCGYRGDWIQPGHKHLYRCGLWRVSVHEEDPSHPRCECRALAATTLEWKP